MPTVEFDVLASGDDGNVGYWNSSTYPPGPGAGTPTVSTTGASLGAERTTYGVDEGIGYNLTNDLIRFDTSSLPDDAIIESASIEIYPSDLYNDDTRAFVGEWYSPTWPIAIGDYSSTPVSDAWSINLADIVFEQYNSIPLTNLAINKTGYTAFRTHISGGIPTVGSSVVYYYSYNNGSNAPKLSVTYSIAQTRVPISDQTVGFTPNPGSPNYGNVDKYPSIDDSTYNYATQSGNGYWPYDYYGISPFTVPEGSTIDSVKMYLRAQDPSSPTFNNLRPQVWVYGDSSYDSDDDPSLGQEWGATWEERVFTWAKNPHTGNDWTVEEVNAMNEIAVYGGGAGDYGTIEFSRVYIEVLYTPSIVLVPDVTAFTIPSTYNSLTVPINSFETDNSPTGWLVNESPTTPASDDPNWKSDPSDWANYTFVSAGTKTLYAWAQNSVGISTSLNASVIITISGPTNDELMKGLRWFHGGEDKGFWIGSHGGGDGGVETFYSKFGSYGTGDGEFNYPSDVCVYNDEIYVVDDDNNRVQVFNLAGIFQRKWVGLHIPFGISVYSDEIYISDSNGDTIQVFDPVGDGTPTRQWGSSGSGNGELNHPFGISVYNNEVYVADSSNNRIQVFDLVGTYKRQWGSSGSGNGDFSGPADIFIYNDEAYVADYANNRIQVFDLVGTYKRQWGVLYYPNGIFVQDNDDVYVSNTFASQIQVFDSVGTSKRQFGSYGTTGDGKFNSPYGIYIYSGNGKLYVADYGNHRIQVFDR